MYILFTCVFLVRRNIANIDVKVCQWKARENPEKSMR